MEETKIMGNNKPALLLPTAARNTVVAERRPLSAEGEMERYGALSYNREYGEEVEKGSALDYWRLLARRKGTLIALAICGALAGVIVTLSQSPVYRARTSIEVQDFNHDLFNTKVGNPVEESSPANALTDVQTQLQILQSQSLIERTLDKLHISTLDVLDPQTIELPALPRHPAALSRDALLEAAARNLKVAVEGQTRLLEVTYQSTDPKIAAGFANTLAEEFIDQNMEARWQAGQRTSAWLGQQLDELRVGLQRSDDALQAYARKQGLIYTADRENVSTSKLRQLQAEVSQAQADRVVKESRFKIASSTPPETLPDVLNDNSLQALQTSLTDLRRQQANLAITFSPDYSKAKRIRAEIETLENALDHERSQIVSRIANDFQEAEHREGMLSAAYEAQVRLVMADSQKSIQYDILKREVDTNRQIYEAMLQRVKESSIASALKPSNIRIIDPARVPEKPYKPNLPVNGGVGTMCGIMLGVMIAVTRDRADRSLQHPGDAGRLLGIPELGVIPRTGRVKTIVSSPTLTIIPAEANKPVRISNRTVAWHDLPAGLADSFRAVLASINFSRNSDSQNVLVITSAGPNEGKTTTATNLAVALAKTGQKVLLIDGDIRKPLVHEVFGLNNTAGVTNLLNEQAFDPAAAEAIIQKTEIPNLHVLTSGPALRAGCDLLFSTSMPRVIAHFRTRFDMIIIDTPPLLHMPDARVLGRMADAVVLVARAGRTLREAAAAASERLLQDGTPVLGIILNDWNPKSSPDSFYGNYNDAVMKRYNLAR
jgi:succinoglycan biosynthesis transport protein ExoP